MVGHWPGIVALRTQLASYALRHFLNLLLIKPELCVLSCNVKFYRKLSPVIGGAGMAQDSHRHANPFHLFPFLDRTHTLSQIQPFPL